MQRSRSRRTATPTTSATWVRCRWRGWRILQRLAEGRLWKRKTMIDGWAWPV